MESAPQILQLDPMQVHTHDSSVHVSQCFQEADFKSKQVDVA
jgi:hypothetical protein